MGHCNSKQQKRSSVGVPGMIHIDSSKHPNSSSMTTKLFATLKQSRRISTSEAVGASIGSERHQKPQLVVTYDGDRTRSRSTTSRSTEGLTSSITSRKSLNYINYPAPPSPTAPTRSRSTRSRSTSRPRKRRSGAAVSSSRSSSYQPRHGRSWKPSIEHEYHIPHHDEPLGHGIAGQVRECVHRETATPCAVKTITKAQIRRKDRIKREIGFLKKVHHPHIIELRDVYEDEEEVHIVTELCRGGELFDRIVQKANASKERRNRVNDGDVDPLEEAPMPACFPERDARRIVRELLSAVSYLHANDLLHRDIKPENILFTERDDDDQSPIKLIDFGLSIRHTPNCPPLRSAVGTSYYMAPELLDGEYDRSCDMWSVGVITYVMLTGRPPFNGSSDDVIFKKIRRGRYKMEGPAWDEGCIGEEAKDFVRCLLDLDPGRRWTADRALEHDWLKLA